MADYSFADLEKILDEDFLNNQKAFMPGHRNDDTVNFLIICHCLDEDYRKLLSAMRVKRGWGQDELDAVLDHVDRIEPYLEDWGLKGTTEAMAYAIDY